MNPSRWFAVFCLGLTCGCSSLDMSKSASLWPLGSEKPQQPKSVAAIWTEGVVHQPGSPPMRGFAGRLIFYGADGTKPVKVDGGLVVYAFDEAGRNKLDARPDRKYVFTPEQLTSHYDKIKIGPAYSIWLPWDEAGGPSKEMSLIARFSPRGGQLVVGEMARVVLPGVGQPMIAETSRPNQFAAGGVAGDAMVRQASYESPVPGQPGGLPGADPAAPAIRSTTIQLPDSVTRQLAAARSAGPGAQRVGTATIVQPGVAGSMAGTAGFARQPAWVGGVARGALPASAIQKGRMQTTPTATDPSPAAFPPSPQQTGQREAHSALGRPRVPGVLVAPLTRDHAALQPHLAGQLCPPESPLSAGPQPTGASTSSAGP
jgi:hypothetical protein